MFLMLYKIITKDVRNRQYKYLKEMYFKILEKYKSFPIKDLF